MIPHTQTDLAVPGGDCFRTCIASILEVPLETIPNRIMADEWANEFNALVAPFGYALLEVAPGEEFGNRVRGCWAIANGKSPRGTPHACIWKDGEIVHDPHPLGGGLVEIETFTVFVARDPAAAAEGEHLDEFDMHTRAEYKRMMEIACMWLAEQSGCPCSDDGERPEAEDLPERCLTCNPYDEGSRRKVGHCWGYEVVAALWDEQKAAEKQTEETVRTEQGGE